MSKKRLHLVLAASLAVTVLGTATAQAITEGGATVTKPLAAVHTSASSTLDTAYPTPSGAIYVSNSGSDSNSGSLSSPVRTIYKGISLAPSGGTVVVRGGTYREGSTSQISKKLTIQNYPHEQVWMDGTNVVTGWSSAGTGKWSKTWDTPSFCAGNYYERSYLTQRTDNTGPCTHIDMAKDPANPAAGDPQMAFRNGTELREVTTLDQVTSSTFYYDQSAKKLYIGADPTNAKMELAARPVAMVIRGGNGFTIKGIGFRRYASNEHTSNITQAAVFVGQPNVTFDRVAFVNQAASGLMFGGAAQYGKVLNSYFGHNGFNGLNANGHQSSGTTPDNLLVESTMFDGNNKELFGYGCGRSCAAAGSKMNHMNGFTVRGNIFQNAKGAGKGFWCDLACSKGVMVNNVIRNNGDTGLFYEVSDTGIIASNLIHGNGKTGLKMGSANTQIYNNTIVNNGTNVLLFDDNRSYGVNGWDDVGPDTTNVKMYNNIIADGRSSSELKAWRTASSPNTGPNTFVAALDYNSYYRPGGSPTSLIEWKDGTTTQYETLSELRTARSKELKGHDITSGTDPFFVNAAAGDYNVRAGSVAYESGKAIPSDVAAAMGVTAGEITNRGALHYPGSANTVATTTTAAPTTTVVVATTTTTTAAPTTTTTAPTSFPRATLSSKVLVSPAHGSTVSGLVNLKASPSGITAKSAKLYLGSSLAHSYTGSGPFSFGWNSSQVPDGSIVKVTWTVVDKYGKAHTTITYLKVANAPVLNLGTLVDGATISGKYNLTMSAASSSTVTKATLHLGSSLAHSYTGSGPYAFGLDTTRLANGTSVRITWTATNQAGLSTSKEVTVKVSN